jgi:hypothetical protein
LPVLARNRFPGDSRRFPNLVFSQLSQPLMPTARPHPDRQKTPLMEAH